MPGTGEGHSSRTAKLSPSVESIVYQQMVLQFSFERLQTQGKCLRCAHCAGAVGLSRNVNSIVPTVPILLDSWPMWQRLGYSDVELEKDNVEKPTFAAHAAKHGVSNFDTKVHQ